MSPVGSPGQSARAEFPQTPDRPSSLGRLDLVILGSDPVAVRLAEALETGLLQGRARVVLHRVRPSDLGGVLRRQEYHLFILPYLPSTSHLALDYEELARWNHSIPPSILKTLEGLGGVDNLESLSASLISLDSQLQGEGYLVPLVALDRRFLVQKTLCGLRPDPIGVLVWPRLWVDPDPLESCGDR